MGKIQQFVEKKQEKNNDTMAVFANYVALDAKTNVAKTQIQLEESCKQLLPLNLINLNNVLCDYTIYNKEQLEDYTNDEEKISDWKVSPIYDHFELENSFNQANVTVDFIGKNKCYNAINFRSFQRTIKNQLVPHYSKISRYPSWPKIPGELVLGEIGQPENNGAICRFIDEFFRPLTDLDRKLMYAHLVTPCWGTMGKKPLFIIAGPDGYDESNTKKIGKSTYVEALQKIHKSEFDLSPDGDKPQMLNSILELCVHSMVRIDNLKTKLPPGILERCITSAWVQAHAYYKGQKKVPNRTCWNITANMPRVDQDLADRGIVIRLQIPTDNDQHYSYRLEKHIEEHRLSILRNIIWILQQEPVHFTKAITRFPEWEHMILNKFLQPIEAAQMQEKNAADQKAISSTNDHEYFRDYVLKAIRLYYSSHSDPYPGILSEETNTLYISNHTMFELWREWNPEKRNVKYAMPHTGDVVDLCRKIGWITKDRRITGRKNTIKCYKISDIELSKQKILIEHHHKINRILTLF
jgi:hypothetical protein